MGYLSFFCFSNKFPGYIDDKSTWFMIRNLHNILFPFPNLFVCDISLISSHGLKDPRSTCFLFYFYFFKAIWVKVTVGEQCF